MCAELYASARSWVIWPRVLQELIELDRQGLGSGIRLDELKDARLSSNEETRERGGSRETEEVSSCCNVPLRKSNDIVHIHPHPSVLEPFFTEGSSQP